MAPVAPLGQYSGDVRDLPQVPSRETPELELMEPDDYVHNSLPIRLPPDVVAPPSGPMPPAIISFHGMSYADTYCQGGQCGGGHPPDTTGAIGSHHYIQAINLAFAIYDKATGTRLAAFTEASLWAGVTGSLCASDPYGDPIVLYDQTADRWILTNFAFSNPDSGPFYECIAVSKSSDPVSGGWWFYGIQMDQGQVPVGTLNDYPKFGVWNDGCLYMGANGFNGNTYNGQIIFSIDRAQMYGGHQASWTLGFLSGTANFSLFPAAMLGNGSSLPSPSTHEYYVQESQTDNAFNVRTITPDICDNGGTVGAAIAVPHATYNMFPSDYLVTQPPPGNNNDLDTLGERMMQWIQYRKVGSTESLWVNHTTYFTGENTSPQWAQINVTGGMVHTSLTQQQIYQRDLSLFRWMGSLAVDNQGDMALCYSTSNGNAPNYPSIQCSGRLVTDPLNQLLQGETEYVAGEGSSLVTQRWGDYSSTTMDPVDDCTFWHTNMYFSNQTNGNNGNYQTQIFAFKYPNCISTAQYTLTVTDVGDGTVTSNDGHINCGSNCSYGYNSGAQVTLTATPAQGWNFSGWSGACSGTGQCQLTMNQNQSVTATFLDTYLLTVSVSGGGSVTSTDGFISCPGTCSHSYNPGASVTLVASPAQGWNFGGWSGACSGTGSCNLTMTQNLSVGAAFNSNPSQFVAVAPCRLVDTRGLHDPIQGGTSQNFVIPQLGGCNIPPSAVAYSLNVTAAPHGPLGYLTIWPEGETQPLVSTLNSPDGRTKANAAIVPAGTSGGVSVYVSDTSDVILDIDGYFAPAGSGTLQFYSLAPCRLIDTRGADGQLGGPALPAQMERDFPLLMSSCIPAGVTPVAYSLNFTANPNPPHQHLGYLTVWPAGSPQPVVSTLNNPTGTTVANAAIVPAGQLGAIAVYAYNTTDLIVDINGYFAAPGAGGYSFYPTAPCRVYDSRNNNGLPFSGERIVNVVGSSCAPPSNAAGYVFNATVVPNQRLGYLTLWPDGETMPLVSTLNAYDGFVTSNMAIVPNINGSTDAYAGDGSTQLILDISGYFAP